LLNNPTVAYFLLMLGFYGLFFELSSPGAIFPGVAGAICLILGLMGMQTLSLNYAGLLLIITALVFFFLEIHVASGGLLTVGGIVALISGSLLLFDSPSPLMRISRGVLISFALLTSAFFVFTMIMALRAQRRRVVSGREHLPGQEALVVKALDPAGTVFVLGEHWSAESAGGETIPVGSRVRVVEEEHLKLRVELLSKAE